MQTTIANAIVNIENMRVESSDKTHGSDSKLSIDVSGNNGNTQKVNVGIGSRSQWYDMDGTRFIVFNYEYGESTDVKDTDKTFFHFRNIWYIDKQFAIEAFTQFESNEFTRLNSRALLGAGVRWQLLHSEDIAVYTGIGLFRSKEELDTSDFTSDAGVIYNNRLNTYIVYKHTISKHSRLVNTLYYQPDISETSDYRLLEQFGLQMDITENLSFKLSIDVSHDSESPELIKETDTSYNSGFEYSF